MSQIFIDTCSGKRFDFVDQKIENICIDDIAYALSNLCRFCGHGNSFYTVCHHSLAVSDLFNSNRMRILGLLHDAHEAYINDIPAPAAAWFNILDGGHFKETLKKAKRIIDSTIFKRFGIDPPTATEQRSIKLADNMLFIQEKNGLRIGNETAIGMSEAYRSIGRYLTMEKDEARQTFLERFDSLV